MLVLEVNGNVQGYVDFYELDGGVGYLIGVYVSRGFRRNAFATSQPNSYRKQ